MTTLISYQSSSGEKGRCDAKCYNAKNENCTCICGGKNHGAGLDQAIENTREMVEDWIAAYEAIHGPSEIKVNDQVRQLTLF
ncbi:MAG: hypothetical protein KC441_17500 [Anaerolineales bacterium]|nr:hypothetical protein [Anaerolineales bacterium]